jgi:endonuclease-3
MGTGCRMKGNQSFDIERTLCLIQEAVRRYPKPAAYALADEGFDSRFEQLVACIISIRTRDELSEPAARALFQRAKTPDALCRMTPDEINRPIAHTAYHKTKAHWIHETACRIVHQYGGTVPCNDKDLLALKGVGPKCASVVLALACGRPAIIVETHVQRLVNAWGYVHTTTPRQTVKALEAKLPRQYWTEFNRWLEPFDKYACSTEHRGSLRPEVRALCPVR